MRIVTCSALAPLHSTSTASMSVSVSHAWRASQPCGAWPTKQTSWLNLVAQPGPKLLLKFRRTRNPRNSCFEGKTSSSEDYMECILIFGPHEPPKRIVRVELLEVLCRRDASTSPRAVPARLFPHFCGSSRNCRGAHTMPAHRSISGRSSTVKSPGLPRGKRPNHSHWKVRRAGRGVRLAQVS